MNNYKIWNTSHGMQETCARQESEDPGHGAKTKVEFPADDQESGGALRPGEEWYSCGSE
jgi:hypothetical protein